LTYCDHQVLTDPAATREYAPVPLLLLHSLPSIKDPCVTPKQRALPQ
jgi:hypothetical protein